MGVPQGTRVRVEWGEVWEETAAVMAVAKGWRHGVAHGCGGTQCEMEACR